MLGNRIVEEEGRHVTRLKDDPEGCVDQQRRGERSCLECYLSQVNDENEWTGGERRLDAQCVVMDVKETE